MSLLEFYGRECPHCIRMAPLIEKLKKEGFSVEQFEVWHDVENEKKFKEYDHGKCGGVPFFINTETGKWICGAAEFDELKQWATGEGTSQEIPDARSKK